MRKLGKRMKLDLGIYVVIYEKHLNPDQTPSDLEMGLVRLLYIITDRVTVTNA